MTKQVLLIDADIIAYRCGFAVEKKSYLVSASPNGAGKGFSSKKEAIEYARSMPTSYISHELTVEPVDHALQNVNTTLHWLLARYPNAEVRIFLSGKGNFRHEVAKLKKYKGNRSPFAKPKHYDAIRDHLVRVHGAIVVDGMEADDEIGIQSTELGQEGHAPIIVSTDKDLDMIPGLHYNWVKQEEYDVTDEEAYRNFFRQLLTGDSVDNVPGIADVGPVTANNLLADCRRPTTMLRRARDAWKAHYPDGVVCEDGTKLSAEEAMTNIGQLLWIKRDRSPDLWLPEHVQ